MRISIDKGCMRVKKYSISAKSMQNMTQYIYIYIYIFSERYVNIIEIDYFNSVCEIIMSKQTSKNVRIQSLISNSHTFKIIFLFRYQLPFRYWPLRQRKVNLSHEVFRPLFIQVHAVVSSSFSGQS